jgi:genome maintenance exonuclease 1
VCFAIIEIQVLPVKKFIHNRLDINGSLQEETTRTGRSYSTPEGVFPSVTTVVGFEKQKFFAKWRANNATESVRVTTRGTDFHGIIEDYMNNKEIDFDKMMPNMVDIFIKIQPLLHRIDNIRLLEAPLWSSLLGLAGRTDCIADFDGELSIIDFKASTKTKRSQDIENYFLQATAYAMMLQERTSIKVNKFSILIACENGSSQVFEGKPITYVKKLKEIIDRYKEHQYVQNQNS